MSKAGSMSAHGSLSVRVKLNEDSQPVYVLGEMVGVRVDLGTMVGACIQVFRQGSELASGSVRCVRRGAVFFADLSLGHLGEFTSWVPATTWKEGDELRVTGIDLSRVRVAGSVL
jgi:hypothetical protein